MKGCRVYMIISFIGVLHAGDQGLMSPRQSPLQDSLHLSFGNELEQTKTVPFSGSEKKTAIPLSAALEAVSSTLARRVTSTVAVCAATSIVESNLLLGSQDYCVLQAKIDSFKRELERSKEQQQNEFDCLTQEVRRVTGSISTRPLNDDLRSELMGMLLVIGDANPHLKVNPIVKVPSLRLEAQFSSSQQGAFSLRKHTDLSRKLSEVLDDQKPQKSSNDRRQLLMLEDAYVDQTFDNSIVTRAVPLLEISDNSDDDSPVIVAPMSRARRTNVANDDEATVLPGSVGGDSEFQRGQSLYSSAGSITSDNSGSIFRCHPQGLQKLDHLFKK